MMKGKGKWIALGGILTVLVVLTVGLLFASQNANKREKAGIADSRLFWNVQREPVDSSGIPERAREEDGYYKVLFAVDGKQEEYRVLDEKVMASIDENTLMGLVINENDVITGTLDVSEVTAGEVASYCYVEYAEEDKIMTNSTLTWDGMAVEVPLTSATNIYNVSRKATFVGEKIDTIHTYDRIRAFKNDAGEISHIFMLGNYASYNVEIEKGWCEHCKREVEWGLWDSIDSLPVMKGHFKLTGNLFLSGESTIEDDEHVILDLNGCKVESAYGERVFNMFGDNSHLTILDQSEGKTGSLVSTGTPGGGGVIWMRAGGVDMYSGTIDASGVVTPWYGAAVQIYQGQTFNMYGGTIIGGTAQAEIPSGYDGVFGGIGAGVYVAEKATFNMYGGVIRDGKAWGYSGKDAERTEGAGANLFVAEQGVANIEGGEILNGVSDGFAGNVWVGNDATLNMKGGRIAGGSVVRSVAQGGMHGGNVTVAGRGTFNFSGGEIVNGTCMNSGGNVALYGTMNMSGGMIASGKHVEGDKFETAKQIRVDDENMFIVNATFNMSGGQVAGHVEVVDTGLDEKGEYQGCTVTLSGTANISGGLQGMTLHDGDVVKFTKLESGAEVWITGKGYISTATARENANYVHSDYGVNIIHTKNKLFVGEIHCVCGGLNRKHYGDCDGSDLEWLPWTDTKELPTKTGNWYLTNNVSVGEQQGIFGGSTICLDLKGYLVQGQSGCRVYNTYGGGINLTITDTSGNRNGRILAHGNSDMAGGCVWAANKGKVYMYAGILDAAEFSTQAMGASVYVEKDASFTLYDGTVIGGTVQRTNKGAWGIGGAAYVAGAFQMHGGTIRGGQCEVNGGNIAVSEDGTFNLYGGNIENGIATQNGGNIYVAGKLNVNGGTIQGGKATECGGNIYSVGKIQLKDGMIKTGTAASGGNIRIQESTMKMTGGTICDGKAVAKLGQGGNVYAIRGTEFKMTGGDIRNGEANYQGGNVYVWGSFDFAGGNIIAGKAENGGNVYVTVAGENGTKNDGTMTMSGKKTVIQDGIAAGSGGNVCVVGTLVMSNGVIKNGSANGTEVHQGGGNVYSEGNFKMIDGRIEPGKDNDGNSVQGARYGGNVYVAYGTMSMGDKDHQPQILNGKAEAAGNIWLHEEAILTIHNGIVRGGHADQSGNIHLYHETSTLNMESGIIENGIAEVHGGGNICVQGNLNVTGGAIRGGKNSITDQPSGGKENIFINQFRADSGAVVLKNCEIEGVYVRDVDRPVQINAGTKILAPEGNDTAGFIVDTEVYKGTWLAMEEEYSKESVGRIVITTNEEQIGKVVMEKGIVLADRERFTVNDGSGVQFMFQENQVTLQSAAEHIHCACDGMANITASDCKSGHWDVKWIGHETIEWVPKESGYYYLMNDATAEWTWVLDNESDVSICLDGHTYTGEVRAPIQVSQGSKASKLTLCNGTIAAKGTIIDSAACCIKVNDYASLTLYGVKLDASKATLDMSGCTSGSVLWIHPTETSVKAYDSTYKSGKVMIDGNAQADTAPILMYPNTAKTIEGLKEEIVLHPLMIRNQLILHLANKRR